MNRSEDDVIEIVVPEQQEGTRATVQQWLKQTGDWVHTDEPVVELETDKVVVEVAATGDGELTVLIEPETPVEPGAVLGQIKPAADRADSPSKEEPRDDKDPAVPIKDKTEQSTAAMPLDDAERRLSPSVRRLVRQHSIDPASIDGTGRKGRVTREDVLAVARQMEQDSGPERSTENQPRAARKTATPQPQEAAPASGQSTKIPHTTMRRRIAEHMQQSLNAAPHVTSVFEADFGAIQAHRSANKQDFKERGVNLTYTAYFVRACVEAMQVVPVINSRWHDDFIEQFDEINIGLGVDMDGAGLIVPVIHQAEALSLLGTAARIQEKVQLARDNRLKPGDMQNGTFTISNHGVSGSLIASPIVINQPQSAILGIGALEKRVKVRTVDGVDSIQIRPMAYVTLSIDHRVIDGAQANKWLSRFVDVINNWPAE